MCGCGGSQTSAQQAPRETVVQQPPSSRPLSYTDEGFVWNGPKRPAVAAK
jgi:hypothetical protein